MSHRRSVQLVWVVIFLAGGFAAKGGKQVALQLCHPGTTGPRGLPTDTPAFWQLWSELPSDNGGHPWPSLIIAGGQIIVFASPIFGIRLG